MEGHQRKFFDEIVQKMQIPEKLHKLTKRWLRVLIKEKVIEEKAGGYQLIQQEKDFDVPMKSLHLYGIIE